MILVILVIVAAWVFNLPLAWQVTLTIFASFHLLLWVTAIIGEIRN